MRLWLDDTRAMPLPDFDIACKHADVAIFLIKTNAITYASLDYDLGIGCNSGLDVAQEILGNSIAGSLLRIKTDCHSISPDCRQQVNAVLRQADAAWDAWDQRDQEICITSYADGGPYSNYSKGSVGFLLSCIYHLDSLHVAERVSFLAPGSLVLNGVLYAHVEYRHEHHGYPFLTFEEGAGNAEHRGFLIRRQEALLRKVRNAYLTERYGKEKIDDVARVPR